MLAKIRNNLKEIDIFGQQITMSFRQEAYYRTSLGGFLSLCIIGVVISFFYSNIIQFFAMNVVTSEQSTVFKTVPESVDFSQDHFMFAVRIDQTNFLTKPYFNITLEQREYVRDENGTQSKKPVRYVDLVPCTIEHLKPITKKFNVSFDELYDQYSFSDALCPSLNDTNAQNLSISGAYSNSLYQFLKISVNKCVENNNTKLSWKPTCKNDTELETLLKTSDSFRLQFYITNFLINPNKAKGFVEPYIAEEQFYSFVPNKMFVQSDIFFRKREVTTDTGILMYPSTSTDSYTTMDYQDSREQIGISSLVAGYYGAFYFRASPYSYKISRSFEKLDQLLSYLGGFTQFMVVIVGIAVRFYNREHMVVEIANDLYDFDYQNDKKKKKTTQLLATTQKGRQELKQNVVKNNTASHIQIQSLAAFNSKPNMQQHEPPGILSIDSEDQRENAKEQMQTNLNTKVPISQTRLNSVKIKCQSIFEQFKENVCNKCTISMSFRLILSQILPFDCIKNKESKLIEKAINQVNKEVDLQFIIKQLHELIKLKKVLFNSDQIALFNFSRREIISLRKDMSKQLLERQSTVLRSAINIKGEDTKLQQLFLELINSYQAIVCTQMENTTEDQIQFNQRLIQLLGTKIPTLLEKEINQVDGSDEDPKSEGF